jgi:hypothetical protein
MIYITDTFDIGSLVLEKSSTIVVTPLTLQEAQKWARRPHQCLIKDIGTVQQFNALLDTLMEPVKEGFNFKVENSTSRLTGYTDLLVGTNGHWLRIGITTRTK